MSKLKFKNVVRIHGTDLLGKVREQNIVNTNTYAYADVLIAALLQSGPSRVTHLYAQYGPSGTPPSLPSDLRLADRDSFVTTGTDSGGIWVPILAAPSVDASDATLYNGNQATFYFRVPGTLQASQVTGTFQPGSSYIYALGLAVATNANDRNGDIIVSILNTFTPFVIPANGQEAVDYPLQITL
jgi:hypothetical protein